jgi:uncharacterized protein YjbI with pentapeptide repeats
MYKTPKELGFVYDEGGLNRWVLSKSLELDRDCSEDCLSDSCILRCEFRGVSFRRADCRNVAWFWSYFEDCDFCDADLAGADLRATGFKRCRFDRATLRVAELRGAGFTDCTFHGADLQGARVGYLQSFLIGLSKKQRTETKRSLLGLANAIGWAKAPPGG